MKSLRQLMDDHLKRQVDRFKEFKDAENKGEPILWGGITNGFIITPDRRIFFLRYDPMRQFRSTEEIRKEIKELLEGNRGDMPKVS